MNRFPATRVIFYPQDGPGGTLFKSFNNLVGLVHIADLVDIVHLVHLAYFVGILKSANACRRQYASVMMRYRYEHGNLIFWASQK